LSRGTKEEQIGLRLRFAWRPELRLAAQRQAGTSI
jgi:hypothetical protein